MKDSCGGHRTGVRASLNGEGAENRLRALVFEFYARVRDDDLLGPVFEARLEGKWEEHLERMCDFWSTVLHATGRYRGDPVGSHARIPDIAPHHFDRWIELFEETAHDVLPPREAADIVGRSRRMRAVLERAIRVRSGEEGPPGDESSKSRGRAVRGDT
jgi:hemoglobin